MFGSVLGVSTGDVWMIVAVAVVTAIVIVVALYRPLLFTTFDPEVADVSGVKTRPHRRAADAAAHVRRSWPA